MAKTLEEHFSYLTDRVKLDRYEAAINRLVRPEHIVLDLGCGTGVLGLMALRAGARKILFVEEGEIIEAARKTITEAGFGEQSEFYQVNSFELTLTDKADIVLCDHIGYFGFDYGVLDLLADAKTRFLRNDGKLMPANFALQLAPIESQKCRALVGQWRDGSVAGEFRFLGDSAANTKHAVNLGPDVLLAESAALTTVELGADVPDYVSWNAEFVIARDGILDGLAGWFDCQLQGEIRMTNGPVADGRLDRPLAFFPIDTSIDVRSGERVAATIMVRHRDGVIAWVVELPDTGRRFAHTTFNGMLLDAAALNRGKENRVANLNDRGRARQIVLSYCDGTRTLAEVEALVQREHPQLFPSPPAITYFVKQVLASDTAG